jgi:hypothetical protein
VTALAAGLRLGAERSRAGRTLVLIVLFAYFMLLLALGGHMAWKHLGVPATPPSFSDLRSVTSGWECVRKHVDVLPSNPCDPWGARPANYPRLWLWPSHLGLGQSVTITWGLATAGLFFWSFLALVGPCSLGAGLVFAAGLVSPAVMLGVERGNADLIVFSLLALAIVWLRHPRPELRAASHALFLLTGILKLFPVFAWGVLIRQPRRWALFGGGSVAVGFLVYALATLDDIETIRKVVPQAVWFSYGAGVAIDALRDRIDGQPFSAPPHAGWWTALVLVPAAAGALRLAWRRRGAPVEQTRSLDAFVAGAGIYVASFLLLHNWDYRLAVLLLTLPQLVAWCRADSAPLPWPRATLAAVLGTLYLSEVLTLWDSPYPFEELLNWLIFVAFACALAVVLGGRALVRLSSSRT